MDIRTVRVENLKIYLKNNGGPASIARTHPEFDPSYASQLVNGHRRFGEKAARKMEKLLKLPYNYFDQVNNPDQLENYNIAQTEQILKRVPLFDMIQAGDFREAFEDIESCEHVGTDAPVNKYTYALKVIGDSMEPIFKAGMIVIVDPQMSPVPNDFVIAKNGDNEATLKQLVKDGPDWYLKPLNSQYPTKDATKFNIVGVVIQVQSITRFK